jgi:parallel beta helix pectate lyase-like protein
LLINNTRREKINKVKVLRISILLAILILAFIFFIYPLYLNISSTENKNIILCDAEQVYGNSFISNGKKFSAGNTQSNDFAHSGQYSCKLEKGDEYQFGFGYEFSNIQPGEIYEASVWMKKNQSPDNAFLVFSGKEDSKLYMASAKAGKTEKGFEQISMYVKIPKYFKDKKAKVYVYSRGEEVVYFDDLKIVKLDSLPDSIPQYHFDPPHLDFQIKDKNYRKLQAKIEEAFSKGVLITDEDSWVNANLIDNEEKIPVKIRLKGDWLDHLKGDKWSFRIKPKDSNTWNRMTTFSVQTPASRYYALEWLLHQFWEKEDVLTTRYDFISLSVNGKVLGAYAYEEHFEKQLLEFRKRREGPIVRFSEDGMWDIRVREIQNDISKDVETEAAKISSATISPFKESKIAKSGALLDQYNIAQNLLFQYQEGLKSAEEIFDLDQMAKYNAVVDIFGAHHSIVWHNQRFYYNPVTSLLEPIGFDGFAGQPRRDPLVLGKALLENGEAYNNGPLSNLFNDDAFIEKYMAYLYQYTDEDYLNSFFNETADGMAARVEFLKTEFPEFYYSKERIIDRARQIRFRLLPYQQHSIKANWQRQQDGNTILQVSNSHELPLKIVGTGPAPTRLTFNFEKVVNMPAFRMGNLKTIRSINAPADAKYIFYKPYGIDTLFSSQIGLFELPSDFVPRQELFTNLNLVSNELYIVREKDIIFKKGIHKTAEDIIIPASYKVIFQAGFSLDLIKRAKFISKSPVFLNGTAEDPIQIFSSDKTANGFTVLQSPETSVINFATFSDLNTLSYKGWNLTGAVTFYESDVTIQNLRIVDNHCEDALNTIRSKFTIDNMELVNSAFDGFDADFCTGRLSNSVIKNPGNDGVDFSGSNILVTDCQILHAGDKGISAGEESKITVHNTLIDGAVIGAASKDLSYLKVKNLQLKDCNQGFAAYQKKPEYGRSTIFVEGYAAENVKYLHTIAPRCTLELNGHVIVGE